MKPLNSKAYGSIGHLPNSRLGPGDHSVNPGQAKICFGDKHRRGPSTITIQEKLDGSCVAVAKIDGILYPLVRSGHPATSSGFEQHQLFHNWVWSNEDRFRCLKDGERIVGEWLAQAHGTRYLLQHEPFVAFDIMRGKERLTYDQFMGRTMGWFVTPALVHRGDGLPVDKAMALLGSNGRHGALDPVEGVVYRVEYKGKVDFLAKWVRPDKVDGCYFPIVTGKDPVWNWRPMKRAA